MLSVHPILTMNLGEAQNSSTGSLGDHLEKSINEMMRTLSNQ